MTLDNVSITTLVFGDENTLIELLKTFDKYDIKLKDNSPLQFGKNYFYINCEFISNEPHKIIKAIETDDIIVTRVTIDISSEYLLKLNSRIISGKVARISYANTEQDNKWLTKFKHINKRQD